MCTTTDIFKYGQVFLNIFNMKRFLILLIFIPFLVAGQTGKDLLIFSVNGDVSINRGRESIQKIIGQTLQKTDLLKISNGSVTIINMENKRIVVSKSGTYTCDELEKMMQEAETSLTNRYFALVWKKMNKHEEAVNRSGGIIRGEKEELLPLDSTVVLSDTICFYMKNEAMQAYKLVIKDEKYRVLKELSLKDSIFTMPVSAINAGKTGTYFWEIEIPFVKAPDTRCFFIPEKSRKKKLLKAYNDAESVFSNYDYEIKSQLTIEYLIENRVYVY